MYARYRNSGHNWVGDDRWQGIRIIQNFCFHNPKACSLQVFSLMCADVGLQWRARQLVRADIFAEDNSHLPKKFHPACQPWVQYTKHAFITYTAVIVAPWPSCSDVDKASVCFIHCLDNNREITFPVMKYFIWVLAKLNSGYMCSRCIL